MVRGQNEKTVYLVYYNLISYHSYSYAPLSYKEKKYSVVTKESKMYRRRQIPHYPSQGQSKKSCRFLGSFLTFLAAPYRVRPKKASPRCYLNRRGTKVCVLQMDKNWCTNERVFVTRTSRSILKKKKKKVKVQTRLFFCRYEPYSILCTSMSHQHGTLVVLDVDGCKYQYQFNENNPHNIDDAYLSCGAHAWMHAPFRLGSWAVYRFLLCMIVAVIFIIFFIFHTSSFQLASGQQAVVTGVVPSRPRFSCLQFLPYTSVLSECVCFSRYYQADFFTHLHPAQPMPVPTPPQEGRALWAQRIPKTETHVRCKKQG